ncbi:ATP-binding cassette domain-containing protein [Aeromicrobium sp. 636]|uniref:ABC transporter ATP-binding protein n=1 Tax=Aeromicrobium senzhongii TaxID=2663859 RepID=A0A8I0ERP3_9ACTN|nr:ABC transporter ATP-binding protein [Aeromicrobium sp. 636]MBC9224955.1 ABC transporter ATP-binding protein [Aeromicrobium senzhongii]MCQ3997066.1 ATP-binding cassette domain-containing protein [Aeromicrobium sp. 636]
MTAVFDLTDVTIMRSGKLLLDHVSWRVEPGEHWVIVGPNGAGKTTLLQVASANMHPTSGSAEILGERLGAVDVFELRPRIGHTSAAIAERVPPTETVRNLILSAAYAVLGRWNEEYDDEDHRRAMAMLAELGIAGLADRTFGTLSEGEKKRVLLARSLMTDPEVVLLDEPAAGLDVGAREDLVESLEALASDSTGPSLVMVSHHLEEIAPGFTHALLLSAGRVVAAGPIEETLTSQNLSTAFRQRLEVSHVAGRFSARRPPARHRAN